MEALRQQFAAIPVDLLRAGVWLVLLLAIFVPLEKLFALHRKPVFRKALSIDVAYYFLGSVLPKLILVFPLTIIAGLLHRMIAPVGLYIVVSEMPVLARVVAALVVGEVGAYWGHRLMHAVPWLWRFHAIHHSAEEIDWLVNTRAHPVDLVFTRLCGLIPMYVLGLAQPFGDRLDAVPVVITLVGTSWGFFIHANVNWRFGWLEWLVSTPAFHHLHHANDGPESLNKNFSALLPLVDKCFGTFRLPENPWPAKYGTDSVVAEGLAGQLLDPFLGEGGPPVPLAIAPSPDSQ